MSETTPTTKRTLMEVMELFFGKSGPAQKKEKEIKNFLEKLDRDVMRTSPLQLTEERMHSLWNTLNTARDGMEALESIHPKHSRYLSDQIEAIKRKVLNRWETSPHNSKSSKSSASPRPKTNISERKSVSHVNEKMPRKTSREELKQEANGRNEMAKVHVDAPEREKVTTKYYNTQTERMISAGAEALDGCSGRDNDVQLRSYAAAASGSSSKTTNFAKPPAVAKEILNSNFKIHKDSPNKIPSPLQPAHQGSVQEFSDADKNLSLITKNSTLSDYVHNQFYNQNFQIEPESQFSNVEQKQNFQQISSGVSGHLHEDKYVQTSDASGSKLTPNVETFFDQNSKHPATPAPVQLTQAEQSDSHKHSLTSESSYNQNYERYPQSYSEQNSERNRAQNLKLLSSSDLKPTEPSDHASRRRPSNLEQYTKYSERDSMSDSKQLQPSDRNYSSGNSERLDQNKFIMNSEHAAHLENKSQVRILSNQNVHIDQYKPASSESQHYPNFEQHTAQFSERHSEQASRRVQNRELTSGSRPTQPSDRYDLRRTDRPMQQDGVNQYSERFVERSFEQCSPAQNREMISSGSDSRSEYRNDNRRPSHNLEPERSPSQAPGYEQFRPNHNIEQEPQPIRRHSNTSLEQNQVVLHSQHSERNQPGILSNQNVHLAQNRPNTYANIGAKQTGSRTMEQQRIGAEHHSQSFEQENPNSILQNMWPDEHRPDWQIDQNSDSSCHHQSRQSANQHVRQYPGKRHEKPSDDQANHQQNQQQTNEQAVQKPEKEEEVVFLEKPKRETDEIMDINVHFQNNDLKKSRDTMPKNEYIALVRSRAQKFESKIEEAVGFDLMEFFIVEENLNQYINFLDITNTKDSEELMQQKIEAIKYIKYLQEELDKKRTEF